jgi:hypothetical protein
MFMADLPMKLDSGSGRHVLARGGILGRRERQRQVNPHFAGRRASHSFFIAFPIASPMR